MAKEAHERATAADARIEKHEAVCAERWKHVIEALASLTALLDTQTKAMTSSIRRIYWWQLGVVLSVAASAIVAVAVLLVRLMVKAGVL